jgi:hypothetical protein
MIALQWPQLHPIVRRFSVDLVVTAAIAANQSQAVKQTAPWTAPWVSHWMLMWVELKEWLCLRSIFVLASALSLSLYLSLSHPSSYFPIDFLTRVLHLLVVSSGFVSIPLSCLDIWPAALGDENKSYSLILYCIPFNLIILAGDWRWKYRSSSRS